MKIASLAVLAAVLCLGSLGQDAKNSKTPCLVVRPTEGFRTAFGQVGTKYEYMDSLNFPNAKMKYSKGDLEKLQKQGVHVVMVQRGAERHEIKEARDSCSQ